MTPRLSDMPELDDELGGVICACLEALEAGQPPEALLGRYPQFQVELHEFFAGREQVQRLAAPLRAIVHAAQAPALLTAEVMAELGPLGDFRIVREIGRGGMGVVYEAEQISLRRKVALKVLPFAAALDSRQLQRFKNEAQAAACLHHTHIVPVYFVGCERGVHFYAMQFIEGQTLAQVIEALKETSRQDAKSQKSPEADAPTLASSRLGARTFRSTKPAEFFRTVAKLGIQAAEALDYAHQMGIIHRDIKPANLLIETAAPLAGEGREEGLRLWITDFGLAQFQSDTRLTMTGDLLGTLRYMSPEQALAQRIIVDHRTDIYSLGITLYELLTLESAFPGKDRQEVLRQIAFEEPKPPRRVNKTIPEELETIVLKAMEKEPPKRYATAQELAADLRRFLLHEPIKARRPSLVERTRKWARRHAALVRFTIVFLILAVGGLTTALIFLNQERQRTKEAWQTESRRRQQARQALDAMSSHIIRGWLAKQEALLPEHEAFLRQALAAYEEFAADTGQEEEARAGVAMAYKHIGIIRRRLGQMAKAEDAYRSAGTRFAQLAADFPDEPHYRRETAATHQELGDILKSLSRWIEAESEFQKAIAIREELAARIRDVDDYRDDLANCYNSFGLLLKGAGRGKEAKAIFRKAIAVQEELVREYPHVAEVRWHLAASLGNLAMVLKGQDRQENVEKLYRRSLELHEGLKRDFPAEPKYRVGLGQTYTNLANYLLELKRPKEAEAAYRQALSFQEPLAAEYPIVPAYRWELAVTYNHLGVLNKGWRRYPAAEDAYRKAIALLEPLHATYPTVRDYVVTLGGTYCNLAQLRSEQKQHAEAVELLTKAIAALTPVVEEEPRLVLARLFLRNAHGARSEIWIALQRPADAIQDLDRALALDDGRMRDGLHMERALAQTRLGRHALAVSRLRAWLQLHFTWRFLWGWPRF